MGKGGIWARESVWGLSPFFSYPFPFERLPRKLPTSKHPSESNEKHLVPSAATSHPLPSKTKTTTTKTTKQERGKERKTPDHRLLSYTRSKISKMFSLAVSVALHQAGQIKQSSIDNTEGLFIPDMCTWQRI